MSHKRANQPHVLAAVNPNCTTRKRGKMLRGVLEAICLGKQVDLRKTHFTPALHMSCCLTFLVTNTRAGTHIPLLSLSSSSFFFFPSRPTSQKFCITKNGWKLAMRILQVASTPMRQGLHLCSLLPFR
ncbi:hypothetical protein RJ640_026327 [Escallonia rubra]|uniref:Uncharacterized protein n=1 Tax=Escallonia rubra TaxID=112253 RepID=A0AA88UF24_9ASTE|nr:hypothetical protein RJ640_026327 [Escallonia rubra]